MRLLNKIILITACLTIIISFAFYSQKIFLSVFTGAVISIVGYLLSSILVFNLLSSSKISKPLIISVAILKLAIITLLLWVALTWFSINLLAFFIGLSTIVIAIFIYTILNSALQYGKN